MCGGGGRGVGRLRGRRGEGRMIRGSFGRRRGQEASPLARQRLVQICFPSACVSVWPRISVFIRRINATESFTEGSDRFMVRVDFPVFDIKNIPSIQG